MRILFACLGNICRSPLMEGLVRARWGDDAGAQFDSAGVGAWHAGEPPDPRAIAIAARHGLDIGTQRARRVVDADFSAFDLILCADHEVLDALRRRAPRGARAELALFLDWAGMDAGGGEVPDPYTGGEREFAQVYALVAAGAEAVVRRLRDSTRA
jgi:protein-tyrosine phosphatase